MPQGRATTREREEAYQDLVRQGLIVPPQRESAGAGEDERRAAYEALVRDGLIVRGTPQANGAQSDAPLPEWSVGKAFRAGISDVLTRRADATAMEREAMADRRERGLVNPGALGYLFGERPQAAPAQPENSAPVGLLDIWLPKLRENQAKDREMFEAYREQRFADAQESAFRREDTLRKMADSVSPGEYAAPESAVGQFAHDFIRNSPYSLASMAASVPVAVMTGGAAVPMALTSAALGHMEAQDEMSDVYRHFREQGLSPDEAYRRAMPDYAANVGVLAASNYLQTAVTAGAGKAVKEALDAAAAGKTAETALGKAAEAIMKTDMGKKLLTSRGGPAAASILFDAISEGVFEEAPQNIASSLTKGEPVDWGQTAYEAALGAASGALFGAGGSAMSYLSDRREAMRTGAESPQNAAEPQAQPPVSATGSPDALIDELIGEVNAAQETAAQTGSQQEAAARGNAEVVADAVNSAPLEGREQARTREPIQSAAQESGRVELKRDGQAVAQPAPIQPQFQNIVQYNDRGEWLATPVNYELMELDDLITSNTDAGGINELYPAEYQPRDRSRLDSVQQIEEIARSLQPQQLGPTMDIFNGASIIDARNNVISGNGRTMAIRRAYGDAGNPSAARYRRYLADNAANLGIDAAALAQMRNPVYVRRLMDEGVDLRRFAELANTPTIAAKSAAEVARQDAGHIDDELLSMIESDENGNLNFNRNFASNYLDRIVAQSERGAFVTRDGYLSQDALRRMKNALVYKAYGDSSFLERISESTDDDMRNLSNALVSVSPNIAKMEGGIARGALDSNLSIRDALVEAIRQLEYVRANGLKVDEALNQSGLFGEQMSDAAKVMLQFFDANKRSAKAIRTLLADYAAEVEDKGDPRQANMFETEDETAAQLLARMAARQGKGADGKAVQTAGDQGRIDFNAPEATQERPQTTAAPAQAQAAEPTVRPQARNAEAAPAPGAAQGQQPQTAAAYPVENARKTYTPVGETTESIEYRVDEEDDGSFSVSKITGARDENGVIVATRREIMETGLDEREAEEMRARLQGEESAAATSRSGEKEAKIAGNVMFAEGYRSESGRTLDEADRFEFVIRPDGSNFFGAFGQDVEAATGGRVKAAPIRLQVGYTRPDAQGNETGFGLAHIKKREPELLKIGYNSAEEYITDIIGTYDRIYGHKKSNRIQLVRSGSKSGVMPLELILDYGDDGFYTIVSAFPYSDRKIAKKIKEPLLYDRRGTTLSTISPDADAAKKGTNGDKVRPAVPAAAEEQGSFSDSNIPQSPIPSNEAAKQIRLAGRVFDMLKKGETIKDNVAFARMADAEFGGTQSEGAYVMTQAYDALEMGVNLYIRDKKITPSQYSTAKSVKKTVAALQETILDKLPTMNIRDARKEKYQQFSTPPNYSAVVNWLLGTKAGDVVLEPSAGLGGLAVFAKNAGAAVYVNELDPQRAALLSRMGFDGVFTENAEQIDNVLPHNIRPNRIVMNPPFSSSAGRTSRNDTMNAAQHIEQALERLADGGRAVMILGKGMADDAPRFKEFWNGIKERYNVRANVELSGKDYAKYGTTFGNVIVVVDKTGPTPSTGSERKAYATVTGDGKTLSLDEAIDLLEGVAKDGRNLERRAGEARRAEQSSRGQSVVGNRQAENTDGGALQQPAADIGGVAARDVPDERAGMAGEGGHAPGGNAGGLPESDRPDSERPANNVQRGRGEVRAGGSGRLPVGDAGRGGVPEGERPAAGAGTGGAGDIQRGPGDVAGRDRPAGQSDGHNEGLASESVQLKSKDEIIKERAKAKPSADEDEMVYEHYVSSVAGKEHPADLDEPAAMAAVQAPEITVKLKLPDKIIKDGLLSAPQIEAVARAVQSFETTNPDGTRRGFFIGDGTGVGKGREIAGIIMDQFAKGYGNGKAVWLSKSHDLANDARRDWEGLGNDGKDVIQFSKYTGKKRLNSDQKGILFSAYTFFDKKTRRDRAQEMKDWLGEDFDGVIVLDEAHIVNNVLDKKGQRGDSKASKRALAVRDLILAFPKARVVYVSATGATEIQNLGMLERLYLWGEGTAFQTLSDFLAKIGNGGMAALELVARDMKAMGLYIARSLSMRAGPNGGDENVTFSRLEHRLTEAQKTQYNEVCKAWSVVVQNVREAVGATKTTQGSNAYSQLYGAMQSCYNQILTSMSIPSVISSIEQDLKNGNSVVLQLTNTNEAAQNRAAEKLNKEEGDTVDDLDVTPRDSVIAFLEKSFPVEQYEEYEDDNGNRKTRLVLDSNGKPVLNKKAVKARDELIEHIRSVRFPDSPMDMIIKHFGVKNVAEVTGRSKTPNYERKGNAILVPRGKNANRAEMEAFQDGRKRILIFSDAGGTGFSFHADKTKKNQQKRIHYMLQPGWNAAKAVQGLGRTNRSNQAHKPHVVLVTTNVPGHKRFMSTIARRLEQLGALTLGDRSAQNKGLFNEGDNLESRQSQIAVNRLIAELPESVLDLMGIQIKMDKRGRAEEVPVSQFLNRLLVLDVDTQGRVFDWFNRLQQEEIEKARANGTLDTGTRTLRADSLSVAEDSVVYKNGGVETRYIKLDAGYKQSPRAFDSRAESGFIGYYSQKAANGGKGRVVQVYEKASETDPRTGEILKTYSLRGVNPSFSGTINERTLNNADRYVKLGKADAERLWNDESRELPRMRHETRHLLSGAILPIYNSVEMGEGGGTVLKVNLDDGRSVLGLAVSDQRIGPTLRNLAAMPDNSAPRYEGAAPSLAPEDIIDDVMENGTEYRLQNGWRIKRRRVLGDNRVELVGPDFTQEGAVTKWGVIKETINSQSRYFIPTGRPQTLTKILAFSPVDPERTVRNNGGEERYRIADIRQRDAALKNEMLRGKPVARLTGNEYQAASPAIWDEVFADLQAKFKGKVYREGIGDIFFLKKGLKADVFHGTSKEKNAAFAAVPNILTKGKVLRISPNWKGRGYRSFVIGAPIEIAGERYLAMAVVNEASDTNHHRTHGNFYLHEVFLEKGLLDSQTASPRGTQQPSPLRSGHRSLAASDVSQQGDIYTLLNKVINVNSLPEITPEAINANAPGLHAIRLSGGALLLEGKGGAKIFIDNRDEPLSINSKAFRQEYGRDVTPDDIATGRTVIMGKKAFIDLVNGVSTLEDLNEELYHSAEALVLRPEEIAKLREDFGSEKACVEAYLNFRNRRMKRLTVRSMRFFQRIKDCFDRIRATLFGPRSEDIFRDIADGRVWDREVIESNEAVTRYRNTRKAADIAAAYGRAVEAVEHIMDGADESVIKNARDDISQYGGSNDVALVWGNSKKGIAHIGEKRGGEVVGNVIRAVVEGDVVKFVEAKKTLHIEWNGYEAVLSLDENGNRKTWLLTGWHQNRPDASGEVGAQSGATHTRPTFSRSDMGAGLDVILAQRDESVNDSNVRYRVSAPEQGRVFEDAKKVSEEMKEAKKEVSMPATVGKVLEDVASAENGERTEGMKDPLDKPKRRRTFREMIDAAYTAHVDDLHPIFTHFGKDMYRRAANALYGIGSKARYRLLYGDQDRGAKGLKQIWEMLPAEHRSGFSYYAVLKHLYDIAKLTADTRAQIAGLQQQLDEGGLDAKGRERIEAQIAELKKRERFTMASPEVYEKAIKKIEAAYPKWIEAQKELVKYNRALLKTLEESGIISHDLYYDLVHRYPNYVPLQRDFDTKEGLDEFVEGRGLVNVQNPLKRLRGSERDVIDPLDQIIRNTYAFESVAARQGVAREIVKRYDKGEYDGLMEQVEDRHHGPGESIFYVYEDGKKRLFKTDKDIYEALVRSVGAAPQTSNILTKMLSVPTRALRYGTTHSLTFGVGNLLRDTFSYAVLGKDFRPVVDTVNGFLALITNEELVRDFMRSGGLQESSWLSDNKREELIRLLKGRKTWKDNAALHYNPIALYFKLSGAFAEFSEQASRLGQYKRLLDEGYSKEDAIFETRDNMNFMRAGNVGRSLNRFVPFYNASLQGVDKLCRTMYHDGKWDKKAMARGLLYLTTLSLVSCLYNYGDDDRREKYLNLRPWRKNMFWNFVIGDEVFSIPKPFEAGMIFGSLPERFMDYLWAKDKRAFDGVMNSLLSALTPEFAPLLFMTLFELQSNYSRFFGRQIVPMREQRLRPELQYGPHTAEWAKQITQITKYLPEFAGLPALETFSRTLRSPRMLEYAALALTGSAARDLSDIYNMGSRLFKGETRPAENPLVVMPGVRRLFADAKYGGRDQDAFRKEIDSLMEDYNSAKEHCEQGRYTELSVRDIRHLQLEPVIQYTNKMLTDRNRGINAANRAIQRITVAPNMTAKQKREAIDQINAYVLAMSREGLRRVEEIQKYLRTDKM